MNLIDIFQYFLDILNIFFNKIVCLLGAILSLIFLITGGQTCLVVLMAVDYISGVIKAFIIEKANSKQGFKGLLKKIMMLLVIVLAHQIDLLFDGKFTIRTLTIGILLSNEGLSILENASICGIPIPEKLKNMLEQYKESKNKK